MNFFSSLKSYIEANFTLFKSPLSVGIYDDGNDIMIRPTPSNLSIRYQDGKKLVSFSFQLLTKHQDQKTAYQSLEDLVYGLDGLANDAIASDGSFNLIEMSLYNTPSFVEKTDGGYFIYQAMLNAEIAI